MGDLVDGRSLCRVTGRYSKPGSYSGFEIFRKDFEIQSYDFKKFALHTAIKNRLTKRAYDKLSKILEVGETVYYSEWKRKGTVVAQSKHRGTDQLNGHYSVKFIGPKETVKSHMIPRSKLRAEYDDTTLKVGDKVYFSKWKMRGTVFARSRKNGMLNGKYSVKFTKVTDRSNDLKTRQNVVRHDVPRRELRAEYEL